MKYPINKVRVRKSKSILVYIEADSPREAEEIAEQKMNKGKFDFIFDIISEKTSIMTIEQYEEGEIDENKITRKDDA